jgi:hypothetical protein
MPELPMGFPFTMKDLREVFMRKPYESQKADFASSRLFDKSISSITEFSCKTSASLITAGFPVGVETPKRL